MSARKSLRMGAAILALATLMAGALPAAAAPAQKVTASPKSLNYGTVSVADGPVDKIIYFTNGARLSIYMTGLSFANFDKFQFQSAPADPNDCLHYLVTDARLAPGQSCAMIMRYFPAGLGGSSPLGKDTDTATITWSDSFSTYSSPVKLQGRSIP